MQESSARKRTGRLNLSNDLDAVLSECLASLAKAKCYPQVPEPAMPSILDKKHPSLMSAASADLGVTTNHERLASVVAKSGDDETKLVNPAVSISPAVKPHISPTAMLSASGPDGSNEAIEYLNKNKLSPLSGPLCRQLGAVSLSELKACVKDVDAYLGQDGVTKLHVVRFQKLLSSLEISDEPCLLEESSLASPILPILQMYQIGRWNNYFHDLGLSDAEDLGLAASTIPEEIDSIPMLRFEALRLKRLIRDIQKVNVDMVQRQSSLLIKMAASGNLEECRRLMNQAACLEQAIDSSSGCTVLMAAAGSGSLETVQYFLDLGADPNAMESDKSSALHHAAASTNQGSILCVKALIENSACNIDTRDLHGCTPLMIAASTGNAGACALFLKHGAQINSPDNNGLTPLMRAVRAGHIAASQAIAIKCSPDSLKSIKCRDGKTVFDYANEAGPQMKHLLDTALQGDPVIRLQLVLAVKARDVDEVRSLLLNGLNLNFKIDIGSPLGQAIESGNVDMVQILLDAGADPNAKGALLMALGKQHGEVVDLLLKSGNDGSEGLLFASKEDDMGLLTKFVAAGAKCGDLPVLYEAAQHKHWHLIEYLLDHGALPDIVVGGKHCALNSACSAGELEIVQLILNAGAEAKGPSSLVRDGYTCPVHYAAQKGHLEICRLLMQKGAVMNSFGGDYTTIDTHTPLQWLLMANYQSSKQMLPSAILDTMDFLLTAGGVTPDDPIMCGQTPLVLSIVHCGKRANDPETSLAIFRMLLSKGSDPCQLDNQNRSPLMYAAMLPNDVGLDFGKALLEIPAVVATVALADKDGESALSHSFRLGNKLVLALLQSLV